MGNWGHSIVALLALHWFASSKRGFHGNNFKRNVPAEILHPSMARECSVCETRNGNVAKRMCLRSEGEEWQTLHRANLKDSDGEVDNVPAEQRPVYRGRGRDAHRRGLGPGPRAGCGCGWALGREQTIWSDNLVHPPAVRYRNAATSGVKDSDECLGLSPLSLFTLFFTAYLLRDIVTEINTVWQFERSDRHRWFACVEEFHSMFLADVRTSWAYKHRRVPAASHWRYLNHYEMTLCAMVEV